jgi:hypothetical protein
VTDRPELDSKWRGYHELDFEVFHAERREDFHGRVVWDGRKGWYWWPRKDGHEPSGNPTGPFPEARDAYLAAIHSYIWPNGKIVPNANLERKVKMWREKSSWYWIYLKNNGEQDGDTHCQVTSLTEALSYIAKSAFTITRIDIGHK